MADLPMGVGAAGLNPGPLKEANRMPRVRAPREQTGKAQGACCAVDASRQGLVDLVKALARSTVAEEMASRKDPDRRDVALKLDRSSSRSGNR